ncbi:MAG: site-specific integrase [Pseudonocardiales bacterium]|nr:site-specific integrase [Pseudonocardiales bacterium]
MAVRADGKGRREFEPTLRAIRAFYADLQAWAAAEPEQWAVWVAPCPISNADVRGFGIRKRHVKERMDDRTRQHQPLLNTLVEYMAARYDHLRALLEQAANASNGETITLDGRTYQRLWSRVDERRIRLGGTADVRVLDQSGGKPINVTSAEDAAFFEWAIVEALRHTGIRIEEALELTHLSIRQYQRPNGEIIALLVITPSKNDRERVIPMSAELFSVIAAVIRRHTRDSRTIPLLSRYDPHERQASPAMPFLFQRKIGTSQEVISPATVVNMLRRRCEELAERHPGFHPVDGSFRPTACWYDRRSRGVTCSRPWSSAGTQLHRHGRRAVVLAVDEHCGDLPAPHREPDREVDRRLPGGGGVQGLAKSGCEVINRLEGVGQARQSVADVLAVGVSYYGSTVEIHDGHHDGLPARCLGRD